MANCTKACVLVVGGQDCCCGGVSLPRIVNLLEAQGHQAEVNDERGW